MKESLVLFVLLTTLEPVTVIITINMAPLRNLAPLAALVAAAVADPKTCNSDLPFSCQNSTAIEDTCCFVTAGQLVLTQFWDTDPVTGPDGTTPPKIIFNYRRC